MSACGFEGEIDVSEANSAFSLCNVRVFQQAGSN